MKTFWQVTIFSFLVVLSFGGYARFGIPQIEPAPPPVAEKLDLGTMTMKQFIALGGRLFDGRGTCTLCHNDLGRAPVLNKLGETIGNRLADPRYQGKDSDSAEQYLYESMVKPSAYVVAGFGKAGSNDTESPMPDVSGGSIGLSAVEIKAVIAFMLDSNGMENSVEIPKDAGDTENKVDGNAGGNNGGNNSGNGENGGGTNKTRKPYATAEAIVAGLNCGMCHKMGDYQDGELGPDLNSIGASLDREYLRRAILAPNAEVAEGFFADMMPSDYGQQLYASELEMLVDYLTGLK